MSPTGIRMQNPTTIALKALISNRLGMEAPEDTFLEDIGVVHVQIPARPQFYCYADSGVRYVIIPLAVQGGAIDAFVHEVSDTMRGKVIRAHAQVWEETLPDGERTVYLDLYPCNDAVTNMVAVVPLNTRVLSSRDTWQYVLPRPLQGVLIAGALDVRFPEWEKGGRLNR